MVLAKTLNYTKASTQLHTTQSNLSKIITNMEKEIGVQLLIRTPQEVSLTYAGEVFLDELQKSLEQYKRAVSMSQMAAQEVQGTISVGYLGTAVAHFLPGIVKEFRMNHPKIRLTLCDYTYSRLTEATIDGVVDVAIVPEFGMPQLPNHSNRILTTDDLCLLLNCNHPKAGMTSVDLSSMRDQPFLAIDPQVSYYDYKLLTSMCYDQGFTPNVTHLCNSLQDLLVMVACNEGVAMLAQHMQRFSTEDVCFVPLRGYEKSFSIICQWKNDNNPYVPCFIQTVEQHVPSLTQKLTTAKHGDC